MNARAILFDRDGTLIVDRPNGADAENVELMPHAGDALALARVLDFAIGVVTNQPAIADGTLAEEDVHRIHARIEELAGPIDAWFVCGHDAKSECACRKPAPGLILAASASLGVPVDCCVVIGDIGADMEAARTAGARGVLVPTAITKAEEVDAAPAVAQDLLEAVRLVVAGAV